VVGCGGMGCFIRDRADLLATDDRGFSILGMLGRMLFHLPQLYAP
jgi:hypothetical protein